MYKIKTFSELKSLAKKATDKDTYLECFITFSFGRSSKNIQYDGKLWYVYNLIDDSFDENGLTDQQFMTYTNIFEALMLDKLYMYESNLIELEN